MKRLSFPEKIHAFLKGKKVFCSFSGGSDSLALLLSLKDYAADLQFSLEAVHFEHGFRGNESLDDAEFCRNFCEKYGIPFSCVSLNVPANKHHGEGDEAAARRMRIQTWDGIISDPRKEIVALGHNSDDRMENLMLRLFRGSNASGLTSLREIQNIGQITFVRPILHHSKTEIEDFLRSEGIAKWCSDSTNQEDCYRRNYIRNTLFPQIGKEFPFALKGIRQALHVLEDDADFLESSAQEKFTQIAGSAEHDISFWKGLHPAILVRVLRLWLGGLLGYDYIPDSALVKRFVHALENTGNESGKLILTDTPHSLIFRKKKVCFSNAFPEQESISWEWKKVSAVDWNSHRISVEILTAQAGFVPTVSGHDSVVFDTDPLPEILTVSTWIHGEKMIPFGSKSEKSLKKIFSDAGYGLSEKNSFPVIRADGQAIWLPGIRRSSFAPVTGATKRIARFSIIKLEKQLQHQQ